MVILWPACFSRFSVWMVALSTGSPPSDLRVVGAARCLLPTAGSPASRLDDPGRPAIYRHGRAPVPLETSGGLLADRQGQVVVDALAHLPDHGDQVVQVGGVVHEVDVAGVDHEQRRLRVVEE